MACNFIKKETLTLIFSCEYHKMFKKSFFYGTPPVAASENGSEFLRFFKGSLTTNVYDSTDLNVQIAKSWQLSALKFEKTG